MDEVKKVLESVSKGEITPEEGEKLIEAIMRRNEKKSGERESEEERDFFLGEDEMIDGDLILSGRRVSIRGEIKGDAVLMYCETEFSGKVRGDLVIIGGKIDFKGGFIDQDLVLIGAKSRGEPDDIMGDKVKVANFIASGVLTAISPILKTLGISFLGKRMKTDGTFIVDDYQEINTIALKKLVVNAKLKSHRIRAEEIDVRGELEADEIRSKRVTVKGILRARVLECEKLKNSGKIIVLDMKCGDISGNGEILREG